MDPGSTGAVPTGSIFDNAVMAAEQADLLVFFVIGLLAGAHCLGMCGPLVTAYADRIRAQTDTGHQETLTVYAVRQHALFNLGRAASYAVIGGLVASVGWLAFGSVDTVTAVGDHVRAFAGLVVGVVIVGVGVHYVRGRPGLPHDLPVVGASVATIVQVLTARVDRFATTPAIVGLGAIHGLLPCPILYPAYLYAFALADPLRGAVSLGVLGLGTIPTLFVYGTLLGSLGTRSRVRLHRLLGVAFIVLAYIPIQHGLMLLDIVHLPAPPIPFYDPF